MEFGLDTIIFLFLVAFIAGIVDTLAGGGGLLTLPMLLALGLPPVTALATNKLQSTFATLTASLYLMRKRWINFYEMRIMLMVAFFGSIVGVLAILQIHSMILGYIIPVLLIAIGIFFLFSKNLGEFDRDKRVSTTLFTFTLVLLIGFYDGFFGPATGSFFTISMIFFLGYNLSKATARAKVLNFFTNFGSLLFFIFSVKINWTIGLIMATGQICGALIGAKLIIGSSGKKLIRPLVITVSFAMSLKLIIQ